MKVGPLPYREVIKKARKFGFSFRRSTSGSHEIWWNEKRRKTCVIPHHKEISPGIIRSIVRQMGVSLEDFVKG